ncbi:hypothetical protein IMSAGC015_01541 [Lachnospiraceae bacterium]|nr:hypothetical protein IMSAGC015_01541 [Lachnospiraceae bacterium]
MYIFHKNIHTNQKVMEDGVNMEEARRRLRVCLICVVAIAVIVGFIYYFNEVRDGGDVSEGTLVMAQSEGEAPWQEAVKPYI